MKKRKVIVVDSFGVRFTLEGCSTEFSCSSEEWDIYLLQQKLVDSGANEKDIEELCSLKYSQGYDKAPDEWNCFG